MVGFRYEGMPIYGDGNSMNLLDFLSKVVVGCSEAPTHPTFTTFVRRFAERKAFLHCVGERETQSCP
jgi:hypothetical protein